MTRSWIASVLLAIFALPVEADNVAAQTVVRTWRFDVSLDDKPIGEHEFTAATKNDLVEVQSRARFAVNVLLVPVYRYEHTSREVWRDGCLISIDAQTRQNGTVSSVRGTASGDRFELIGPFGPTTLEGCVKTFAYWDSRFLLEKRLLNAQTGEYQAITTTDRGRDTRVVAGRAREATRHTLTADSLQIDLWYSPEGEWLGLESVTVDGRRLRYDIR